MSVYLKSCLRFAAVGARGTCVALQRPTTRGLLTRTAHAPTQAQRTLTRSMWLLSGSRKTSPEAGLVKQAAICHGSRPCSCGLHTEGDKEMAEFLKEEIAYEIKNNSGTLPRIRGFEVTKSDGSNVTLTKKIDNETITITFNVNHSVDDESGVDVDTQPQAEDTKMVSRPPFTVEINKGGAKTLAIQLMFPTDRVPGQEAGQEGEYEDLLEIAEMSLLDKGQKWEEDSQVYSMSGTNMDGNLYDMTLGMLEDRGITEDFVSDLVTFSTAYEHKLYVGFLEGVKSFVSSE